MRIEDVKVGMVLTLNREETHDSLDNALLQKDVRFRVRGVKGKSICLTRTDEPEGAPFMANPYYFDEVK